MFRRITLLILAVTLLVPSFAETADAQGKAAEQQQMPGKPIQPVEDTTKKRTAKPKKEAAPQPESRMKKGDTLQAFEASVGRKDLLKKEELLPSERAAAIGKLPVKMKQIVAYFYPEWLSELQDSEKLTILGWETKQVNEAISSLTAAQLKQLEAVAPIATEHRDFHQNKPTYKAKHAPLYEPTEEEENGKSNQAAASKKRTNKSSVTTLSAQANDKYVYSPFTNEYSYRVNTDQLVDPLYRTANQAITDLSLSGKTGLEIHLVRSYNSLDSNILEPQYISKNLFGGENGGEGNRGNFGEKPDQPYRTGFIATGWHLNLPYAHAEPITEEVKATTVACSSTNNPCQTGDTVNVQTSGYQTTYAKGLLESFYLKVAFTLDDGSTIEFRNWEPYRYPYKDASYTIDAEGNYVLAVQGGWLTYTFSPDGRILKKTNAFGESVAYAYPEGSANIIITDSYGRTITLFRTRDTSLSSTADKWVVTGFEVREGGVVTKKIHYDVTRAAADLIIRTWTENNGAVGVIDKHVGYWQLDRVRDVTAGNHTLESYTYYPVDSTKMADFNFKPDGVTYRSDAQGAPVTGTCGDPLKTCFGQAWSWGDGQLAEMGDVVQQNGERYGEIAYLLLNKVNTYNGLTVKFNYQNYNAGWGMNTNLTQREQYRGTTRLYQDKHALQYFGYHAVERVDYLYQQDGATRLLSDYYTNEHPDHGWQFNEYWKVPKQELPRLKISSRFGDKQTLRQDRQQGESTETAYVQYRIEPQAAGYLLTYSWKQPWNYLQWAGTVSGGTYTNKDHVLTAYEYPMAANPAIELRLSQPSKVYSYAGNVTDNQNPPLYKTTDLIQQTSYDDWGQPLTVKDALGTTTTMEYGGPFHQVSRQTTRSTDQKTTVTTETAYYAAGHAYEFLPNTVTQDQQYPNPANPAEQQRERVTKAFTAYTTDHQVAAVEERAEGSVNTDSSTMKSIFAYTPKGQLKQETIGVRLQENEPPSPVTVSYQYDAAGRLQQESYPDGGEAQYTYDHLDRVRSSTFIPGDGESAAQAYTIQYDDASRKVAVTTPDGELLESFYSPFGLALKQQRTVNGTTRVTTKNESSDGQQVRASLPYGESALQTAYTYDSSGRPKTATDSIGQVTSYAYSNGLQTGSAFEMKETVEVSYPDGKTETSFYNRVGQLERLLESSASQTRTTTFTYSPAGELARKEVKALGSSGSEQTEATQYRYDARGNLTLVQDAAGHKTQYVYNHQGQVIMTLVNGKLQSQKSYNELGWQLTGLDGDGKTETFTYNSSGLLTAMTDRNGRTKTYTYTPYMEPSRLSVSDGSSEIYWQENDYAPTTRLLTQTRTSENETLTYGYDEWKRPRTQQVAGRTYTFRYDAYDRLQGIQFPDQQEQVYTYDALSRIASVQYPGMNTVNYTYTRGADNNGYTVAYSSSLQQTFTRNAFGEMKRTEHENASASGRVETYTHDGFSNITSLTETIGTASKSSSFRYDLLNRIQKEVTSEGTSEYGYDGKGNRVTNATTQPSRLPMGERKLTYNAMDMLSNFEQTGIPTGTAQASYTYYGDGLRATKTVNGTLTRYVYVNGRVIEELDSSGNVKARNIWGNELLWRQDKASNKAGYYWYNGHGDVVQIKDASGTEINRYAYDIWGNVTEKSEGMSNPFRYTGEIQDDESGYIYLRARYYDPSMGRFINEDTYKGRVNNPLSQNLYTYVHNNPLINVDPTGNYCVSNNGNWAHAGECGSEDSIYMGADSVYAGRPHIQNGIVMGDILATGKVAWSSTHDSGNYWNLYPDDYSYIRWLAGDNDYYYGLDRDTQLRLRQRLLSGYMNEQISAGFPDFWDGVLWGITLTSLGKKNKETKGTGKVPGMPPIVQSRINISNAGWKHVVDRHFSNKNASQFTISQKELRSMLSSKDIVNSPVIRSMDSADGIRYVREVTLNKSIGLDKFNDFKPTSTMTILTDKHGNLITATPGIIK
ncbi:hypothetical protein K0T92_03830 [Paenibacillus oenotherae]|uniref:Teneurin-like YD-shell domain-containing protein n=1 Tax=Paenibacillus oenotherae TaxID=1435645 RepID=A0ABS7D1P7_9BACL|nr:RHS repeat-associated core domain-containing protein [Paenibacillus oenotherae]MBW7473870.1 hypothetical protein [Paenibacillus oenotherae]